MMPGARRRWLHGTLSVVGLAVAWELAGRYVVTSRLFFVPLSEVVLSADEMWRSGRLIRDILVSGQEFLLGFLLAAAVGIALGVAMALSPTLRGVVDPWVAALYATPSIALAPIFILWFGIGVTSKVAIVFLVAVFPIIVNTLTGIEQTDRVHLEAVRAFGASRGALLRKVMLPSALPFIVAGLRLGVGRGIVAIIVGELFGSRAGIGHMIFEAQSAFDTAAVFAGVLIMAVTGVVSLELLKALERRVAPWRQPAVTEPGE